MKKKAVVGQMHSCIMTFGGVCDYVKQNTMKTGCPGLTSVVILNSETSIGG